MVQQKFSFPDPLRCQFVWMAVSPCQRLQQTQGKATLTYSAPAFALYDSPASIKICIPGH